MLRGREMNLENLRFIEDKYDFKYPQIYKDLARDGMLDWGEFGADWMKVCFPKLQNKPPFLLYGDDFEILSFEMILEGLEDFLDEDDYRQTKKELQNKFIPFGQTGAGDLYCFYLDEKRQIKHIVLVWHDMDEVEILANHLEDFMFIELLKCVLDLSEDDLIMRGDFRKNLESYFSTHKKYLSVKQVCKVEQVYNKKGKNFLDDEEFDKLTSELKIPNNTFKYQEDCTKIKQTKTTFDHNIHHIKYRLSITSFPNKIKYYITFLFSILDTYNGVDELDVTIDDELIPYIFEPLVAEKIEYNFEIIYEELDLNGQFSLCLRVNKEKFDPKIIK